MPQESHTTTYTPGKGVTSVEAKKKNEDEALAVQKKQSQSIGGLEKKGTTPMPTQKPGESVSAFGARMREWRSAQQSGGETMQQKAMSK